MNVRRAVFLVADDSFLRGAILPWTGRVVVATALVLLIASGSFDVGLSNIFCFFTSAATASNICTHVVHEGYPPPSCMSPTRITHSLKEDCCA
eukprot:scaffold14106_cov77-Skeletonema_dohrnii-CCMP3373.AAC.1